MGRFINKDTYEGDISNPLNLYVYVGNNPLIYIDPSGNVWEWVGNAWEKVKDQAEKEWEALKYYHSSLENALSLYSGGISDNVYSLYRSPVDSKEYWVAAGNLTIDFALVVSGQRIVSKTTQAGLGVVNRSVAKGTGKTNPISVSDSKMYQLGDHFNKHGRGMGYASKKEYDAAAKKFANTHQNNPNATILEGTWNGPGTLNGARQRAITYDGKTVVIDAKRGQVVDFFTGTEYKGINVTKLQ